jgi:ABC-type uncharacterized transport system substrate-binding protein
MPWSQGGPRDGRPRRPSDASITPGVGLLLRPGFPPAPVCGRFPQPMVQTCRRLLPGLALILASAAVLLLSDLRSRVGARPAAASQSKMRVALLQHASQTILDQGREGMIAGLEEAGWTQGRNLDLQRFNAEGDTTVSQAIAREMVAGGHDLLLTITTPSLQAVAGVNKNGVARHVFGLVTDPFAAGILSDPTDPLSHAPWIAGYGTMQPVAKAFQIAREMNPSLSSVGVVFNNAEANAVAQVKLARTVCGELGIALVEIGADNSASVGEAASALASRGVEAIWVPGDVTVMTAIDAVIAAATKRGIPVFSVIPPNARKGALFDLGADYFEVGRLTGKLAGEILGGRDPTTVPIVNAMPEILALNLRTAAAIREKWQIPDALRRRATLVIDESGNEIASAAPARSTAVKNPNPTGKKWKIAVVVYADSAPSEETLAGMRDQWQRSPLKEGRDYEVKIRSAQGDVAALNGILDAVATDAADLVIPVSTPSLQAALHKIKQTPIVFTLVANPVAAGAGRSYTDHLPNVTGVSVLGPAAEMLDMLERHFPQYRRVGTLFCPSETNSVDLKDAFEKLCRARGIALETVAANSPSELADAALSLVGRPIDAVVQISDNLSSAGFTAITRAARTARKPLISLNSTTVPLGAAVAMGRDYHHAGEVTVQLVERVIGGEDPARMPFVLPPKVLRTASPANAAAVGMTLPDALLRECDKVVH